MWRFRKWSFLLTVAILVLLCVASHAADVNVATTAGRVQVFRDRATQWSRLEPGAEVGPLDLIRSGSSGWARLVLQEGSVIVLGPESLLRLDRANYAEQNSRVLLRLMGGQVRVLVSSSFPADGIFEVETPTAVVNVQRTEFIVIYDVEKAETEVIAIDGGVKVLGLLGVLGKPVLLEPRMTTTVRKGAFPGAPETVPAARFAEARRELDLWVSPDDHLLADFDGSNTRAVAKAPEVPVAKETLRVAGPVRHLHRTGKRWASAETWAIDQSIPEYALTPPGQTPPGSVVVVIQERP